MRTNIVKEKSHAFALHKDCDELIRLLVSIVKTSKDKHGKK